MCQPAQAAAAVEEGRANHPSRYFSIASRSTPTPVFLPLVGVEPAIGNDAAVDHAVAEQLHPRMAAAIAVAADDATAFFLLVTDIDLAEGSKGK